MVLLVGAYDDDGDGSDGGDEGVAQHGGRNRNKAKLIFVRFLWLGLIDLKRREEWTEKGGKQELTGTEVARKITKESRRGLKKGGE